jgi:energy-converting hydrogenase A subunit R
MRCLFISDCEGPISKNDNAFEITKEFIPNGDRLFTLISKYDDILADNLKKPDYDAGSTLKLILPFLKAFNVTERKIEQFSANNLLLIKDSKISLSYIRKLSPAFIVSTSYEQYIKALCEAISFPFENTYCTKLSIDKFSISDKETKYLRKIAKELSEMPQIIIPTNANSIDDFSLETQKVIKKLDNLFWKELSSSSLYRFFTDVIPIGGSQKARAIKDVVKKNNNSLKNVIYFGDSITDSEALSLVKKNGGLAVSFNGNQYAINNSDVAILSDSNLVIAIITNLFCLFGTKSTLKLLKNWNATVLEELGMESGLLRRFLIDNPGNLPLVEILTTKNTKFLIEKSNIFRKKVRGKSVGRLG